jgi:hypothetical protein
MRTRTSRVVLLLFLLIAGASATVFTAYQTRHLDDLGRAFTELTIRIDRLDADALKIGDAQQAYVISSGVDRPTAEQVPELIAVVVKDGSELEPRLRTARAGTAIKTFLENAHTLEQIEARAHDHVLLGQELMAADVISVEGRAALTVMHATLRDIRSAEAELTESDRALILRQSSMAIGAAAGLWLIGLCLLVRIPRGRPTSEPVAASSILSIAEHPKPLEGHMSMSADLAGAADLCTAIARTTDANDLPAFLTRASAALGASGVVVWMAAGDELIAASAHGYDPRALDRLGPIKRSAQNATASAWRLGTMQVVPSGDTSNGALVAPILGTDRCVGVLAVEVPRGRETDATTQAVTRLVAAQFAATLAPWPAASIADPPFRSLDKAAEA